MRLKNILFLAYRNFLRGGIRTALTILAASVGFGVLLSLIAFGFGIEKITLDQISGESSLKTFRALSDEEEVSVITEKDLNKIRAFEGVRHVEPGVTLPAKITFGPAEAASTVQGVGEKYFDLSTFKLVAKSENETFSGKKIYITTALVQALGLSNTQILGRFIDIEAKRDPLLISKEETYTTRKISNLEVIGVLEERVPIIFADISFLKRELGTENYNCMMIEAINEESIGLSIRKVEEMGLNTYFIGDTIKEINMIFLIFSLILGSFGLIALVVAIIGIVNTLTVSLIERTQEIGLLKTFGIKEGNIMALIIFESIFINLSGAIVGIFVAAILKYSANNLFNFYAELYGGQELDLFHTAFWIHPATILVAILIGIFSGLYPSIRASRIPIIKALKYE